MAYDLKNVFYLDTSALVTAATTGDGTAQLDLSAYIDPIARGRTKGTGLAIYRAHFNVSSATVGGAISDSPVDPAEVGVMSYGLIAGLGAGDNATGAIGLGTTTFLNTNNLLVSASTYYGPGATANMNGQYMTVEPSDKVPYVIVRDNVCLAYSVRDAFADGATISVRLECAQITLDQATLNQLLRTQTV